MNLIRKIKIDKITPVLTNEEKEILKFVESWFTGLGKYQYKGGYLFFNKKGFLVFKFNPDISWVTLRWSDFIEVLEKKYLVDDIVDQDPLIRYFIFKKLKIKLSNNVNAVGIQNDYETTKFYAKLELLHKDNHFKHIESY